MTLTDNCQMPYGMHKGTKMENVPAGYLIYLYDNDRCNEEVKDYIIDNMDVLKDEIKSEQMNNKSMAWEQD